MILSLNRKTKETGEQNARRFVKVVAALAKDSRTITCYERPAFYGRRDERYGWSWMANPRWREFVAELLSKEPVRDVRFYAPDSIEGWSFHAISFAHVPRVAELQLDEVY